VGGRSLAGLLGGGLVGQWTLSDRAAACQANGQCAWQVCWAAACQACGVAAWRGGGPAGLWDGSWKSGGPAGLQGRELAGLWGGGLVGSSSGALSVNSSMEKPSMS
jgi:hypothetical protein